MYRSMSSLMDSVAESIKDDIDRYIEREGIDAPVEARHAPVWQPRPGGSSLDLRDIGSIVWAVGFRADWGWLGELGVLDEDGHPRHERGATSVPGFHFLGLPWLHTWGSGRFHAIARDAEHVASLVAEGAAARAA